MKKLIKRVGFTIVICLLFFGIAVHAKTTGVNNVFPSRLQAGDTVKEIYGSMIGHENKIFTIPVGAIVTIDADSGTIRMLEPAVK